MSTVSLVYRDKNYFAVDEMQFLQLQLLASCESLSNERIESDLRAVTDDVKGGENMWKSCKDPIKRHFILENAFQ